jgi:hypothetical protein
MAVTAAQQLVIVDQFINHLEQNASAMERRVLHGVKELLETPGTTQADLRTYLSRQVFDVRGSMASELRTVLLATLGLPASTQIDFVDDLDATNNANIAVSKALADLLATGSLSSLEHLASASTGLVMTTLDKTQDANGASVNWRRWTDPRACSYCRDQVAVYAATRQWFRHYGCRCVKVRGN